MPGRAWIKLFAALTSASVILSSALVFGQTTTPSDGQPKEVTATEPPSNDLQTEVEMLKTENAAVRELLRKMEEQQKTLLDQVDGLQQRLDGADLAGSSTDAGNTSAQPAPLRQQEKEDRYQDGIIIYQNPDDAKVPFLLKFNNNTQIRYLNTLNSQSSYTDHLGVVRDVHRRNDITVNRSMFILGGYIFDKRLQYSLTVWTSAGAASIVVAGNIGWRFNKGLTMTGGYTGVPGSRSLVNTFPFFPPTDRSMADNFFRPGFTQGAWANGEPVKGLSYIGFIGNGLNTLSISANKIDASLLLAGSVWWEPLGPYSEPGKSRQMYDDYFAQKKIRIRVGTSFTKSREDRFSNLDQTTPDNTGIYNCDGVLAFATGAFAPGVTLQNATYKMWAIDGGLKKSGFAVNGQYYFRWLNQFVADGPLPLASTFDNGFELSMSKFVIPKTLALFARSSHVFGQFANSYEYAGGFKWYFLPTERIWITGELMRVKNSPYSGAFTPYTSGMNGWAPMLQTVLAF